MESLLAVQIIISLQTIASLIETSGISGMLKAIPPELLFHSLNSLESPYVDQPMLDGSRAALANLRKLAEAGEYDLFKMIEESETKPTILAPPQALIKELNDLMGEAAAAGAVRRCARKMFEG